MKQDSRSNVQHFLGSSQFVVFSCPVFLCAWVGDRSMDSFLTKMLCIFLDGEVHYARAIYKITVAIGRGIYDVHRCRPWALSLS
jgi:hypothetical protein